MNVDFLRDFNDLFSKNLNIVNLNIENIISSLKNKRNWIKMTDRALDLIYDLNGNSIYDIFDFNHNLQVSFKLLQNLFSTRRKRSVVTGCKNHGKSQILYFTAQMLIELGEIVIYSDKTILPDAFKVPFNDSCAWINLFTRSLFTEEIMSLLDKFKADAHFGSFLNILDSLTTVKNFVLQPTFFHIDL